VRQHNAPQLQIARARLALLLHADPGPDHAAARRVGRHPNRVRGWRGTWTREGFRLADTPGRGRKPAFPPLAVATVKALARELPAQREPPLSRFSSADLTHLVAAHPDAPGMRHSTGSSRATPVGYEIPHPARFSRTLAPTSARIWPRMG
jgi:hypothetical protein